jgi:putative protein-disulfide isomerase
LNGTGVCETLWVTLVCSPSPDHAMNEPLLWYFADPMCSWCWGFSPVIEAVRETYHPRVKIALVLGGLRPGETAPLTASRREEILHHWHQVHDRTGQPFRFEDAMPEGFVYDTEPPSRAVLAVGSIDADQIFPMFKAIQSAFYAEGRNVTQAETLVELAAGLGMERNTFLQKLDSDETRARTQAHFRHARQAGVRGFPTLILQQDQDLHLITHGWQPLADIRTALDSRLGEAE